METKKNYKKHLGIGIIIIGLAGIFWLLSYSGKTAKNQTLPDKYIVKERIIGKIFGPSSFSIKDKDGQYGKIVRDVLSPINTTFIYKNVERKIIVKGTKDFFSWGTEINFYDTNDSIIGSIHEKVIKSMFKWYSEYRILNQKGQEVAHSEKTEYFQTEIIISDNKGNKIALIKKNLFNIFKDTWNIEVFQKNIIDERILPIIVAYKTYNDNKKSGNSSKKKK